VGNWPGAAIATNLAAAGPVIHSGGHRGSPVGFGWNPFNRTEDPTMTDEMIARRALLEKSSGADPAQIGPAWLARRQTRHLGCS
jgi:hypothetical protein